MAEQIFPLEVWTSQITQASIPANENALRVEVLHAPAIAIESVQPASPTDGDIYILGPVPTGAQWSSFEDGNVAIFKGGTWLAFEAFDGWIKTVGSSLYQYTSGGWSPFTVPGEVVPTPVVTKTASFTLSLADASTFIQAQHATVAIAITIPPQSSVAWEEDTELTVRMSGAAAVSFVAGSGVTIQHPASQSLALSEQYSVASLKRVGVDVWALFGDLEPAP